MHRVAACSRLNEIRSGETTVSLERSTMGKCQVSNQRTVNGGSGPWSAWRWWCWCWLRAH
ncbi:MAG TPA: hypothetical protein EYP85_02655 [Armatimonadetes bacterium]|nr:hypothetical protein [Armatimonadota bacterium]